jgi:hypothetical protein
MDTTRPKHPLGLRLILGIVCLAVILFVSFMVWLGYLDSRDLIDSRSPTKLSAKSSLILLVRFDTNAPISFVVTEVWKQPAQTSAQPVKVGAKFPVRWPKDGGPLPDGEVIFYHRDSPIPLIEPKTKLIPWSEYVIRQGRIDDMTVQQFKTSCGL